MADHPTALDPAGLVTPLGIATTLGTIARCAEMLLAGDDAKRDQLARMLAAPPIRAWMLDAEVRGLIPPTG